MATLQKLSVTSNVAIDNKLKHIKAVAAFYNSDCRDVKSLETVLDEICGPLIDHDDDRPLTLESHEPSCLIAYFNKAVVLYHTSKRTTALKLLTALLQYIHVFDNEMVKKVCMLTATILLDTNRPRQAEAVLDLMKNRLNTTFEALMAADELADSELMAVNEGRRSRSLNEFKWMLRYCLLRCKVLAEQPVAVPVVEEVQIHYSHRLIIMFKMRSFFVLLQTSEMLVLKAHQFYLGHDYQMAAKELVKKPINELPNVL